MDILPLHRQCPDLVLDVGEVDVDGVGGARHLRVVRREAVGAVVAVQTVRADRAGGGEIVGVQQLGLGPGLVQVEDAGGVEVIDLVGDD